LVIFLASLLCPLSASEKKKTPPPTVEQSSAPEVVEVGVWPTVIYNLDYDSDTYYVAPRKGL